MSKTIGVLAAGGYADAASHDQFCAETDCIVGAIFDQSPNGNDLAIFHAGDRRDRGVNASADSHTVGGHKVYSAYFGQPGRGYRTKPGASAGVAVGEDPESMYAVFGGTHFNGACW